MHTLKINAMRWKGVNRAEGRKQVRWGWRGGDCLPSDFGLDTTSGMINVCVYACLHFVHMCRRWERAGWGYCYFSEDMMSHCTSHTHTHVHAYSQANTHAVCHCALLLLSVGAASRQWQASRSHSIMRESRGLHLYTHTLPRAHTHAEGSRLHSVP